MDRRNELETERIKSIFEGKFLNKEIITIGFKGDDLLALFYVLDAMGELFESVDNIEVKRLCNVVRGQKGWG